MPVSELRDLLHLPQLPTRIEGFDISNTMGTNSVASMVVWEDGKMKKSDYRRFKIQTVEGANDFASMEEVITRRYGGTLAGNQDKALPFPDVILIDGGQGQLNAAVAALQKLKVTQLSVFGLAKAKGDKEERMYLPENSSPIVLAPDSQVSRLVQTIRDEAHRFALRYHRRLRSQSTHPDTTTTETEDVRGEEEDEKRKEGGVGRE